MGRNNATGLAFLAAFSLASAGAQAQSYQKIATTPVTHLAGIATTIFQTATGIGGSCGAEASPYKVGGSLSSNYQFFFTNAMGSVEVPMVLTGSLASVQVSVNGSPYTLTNANVVGTVSTALCASGLPVISGSTVSSGDGGSHSVMLVIPGPVTSLQVSALNTGFVQFGVQAIPQAYFQMQKQGTSLTIDGVTVSVTYTEPTSLNQECGPLVGPYGTSANGKMSFAFSQFVDAILFQDVVIPQPATSAASFIVNGGTYALEPGNLLGAVSSASMCNTGQAAVLASGMLSNTGTGFPAPYLSQGVAIPGTSISSAAVQSSGGANQFAMFFAKGSGTALTLTQSSPQAPSLIQPAPADLSSALEVTAANTDLAQPLFVVWQLQVPPQHGFINGLPAGQPATGVPQHPNNVTYSTMDPNYSGSDSFTILVGDGVNAVSATFNISIVPPADLTPDPFSFAPQYFAPTNSNATSNTITVSGLNVAAPISVTNGMYQVNGGPPTTGSGAVSNGDAVKVIQFSSASPSTMTRATLTIGTASSNFDVTTAPSFNGKVTNTSGTAVVGGVPVTVTTTGSVTASPGCSQVAGPYSVGSASSATFTFARPVASVRVPTVLVSGNPAVVHFEVNGAPFALTSSNVPGALAGSSCGGAAAVISSGDLGSGGDASSFPSAFVTIPGPIRTLKVALTQGNLMTFGLYVTPVPSLDFDASGTGDLLWQNGDGRAAIWLMSGLQPAAAQEIIGAGTGWSVVHTADFDGDGKSDLVWQHTDGRVAIYLMNGTAPNATAQILNAGPWSVVHTPDLDGDGKADLVFQNADGSGAAWIMNGTSMVSGTSIIGPGTGWTVTQIGDFNGDGKTDLLWTNSDGRVAIWLMDGTSVISSTKILNAASGWSVSQVADLDGDGKADIVWQHTDGSIAVWLMDGATMTSSAGILGSGTGFSVTGAADFDGDGKADLFFAHSDGRASIWLMNGVTPTSQTQILNAGGGWSMKKLVDLDGDGRADIVWQNTDGSVAAWLMNGATMTSGQGILGPGTGWNVNPAGP